MVNLDDVLLPQDNAGESHVRETIVLLACEYTENQTEIVSITSNEDIFSDRRTSLG